MVSLATLKNHLYSLARLAETNGISFEYAYKYKVYRLTIEPTGKRHVNSHRRRKPRIKKQNVVMELKSCKTCGYPMAGKYCINKKCDTNVMVSTKT